MGLNNFQIATLAMMGQSHKLSTISQNIANVNTDGFKRTDTEFQTLISRPIVTPSADTNSSNSSTSSSDHGGIAPIDLNRITQQGQIRTTDRSLDVAIAGSGFFMVSPDLNVNSNILYTRRGSFDLNITDLTDTITLDDGVTQATVNQGFLADQFGNFVLGVPADANGGFTIGTPAPMRIDQFAFQATGVATTAAQIDVNLPANAADGKVETASLEVVDSDFQKQDLRLDFTKVHGTENLWDFRVIGDNISSATATPGATFADVVTTANTNAMRFTRVSGGGGVITAFANLNPGAGAQFGGQLAGTFAGLKPGDQITIAGTDVAGNSNDGTYTIATVSENQAEITLATATPLPFDIVETDAVTFSSTASIPTRLSFTNQGAIAAANEEYTFAVTFTSGETATFTLDTSGFTQFAGAFDVSNRSHNGSERAAIQALGIGSGGEITADFTDGTRRNLYKLTLATFANPNALELRTGHLFEETGTSGTQTVVFADESGLATIIGGALEGSNVDLGVEMTRLIAAQSAYNLAATTFKTADEMLQEAGNLKR